MMNTDSILDGLQKPTWTYGNQDDWDKLTADNAALRELLGEVAKYEEIIHRWLSKGNLEPMWYEDFQVLMSRVQQKLEEK